MVKICIDPGHGGKDPGAIGPRGIQEKDVTLAVAKLLQKELSGFAEVVLTRSGDETRDLWERTNFANAARVDLFISIHCNAATNRSAEGTETFIYKFGGEAAKLAQKVQTRLVTTLKTRNRGVKAKNLHVCRETKMPAILVELAFISNPLEERMLANPVVQQRAARAIAEGFAEYLGVSLPRKEDEEVESIKVVFEGKTYEAFLKDGKTYVEIRRLCEDLGLKVTWNASTKTVEVQK